MKNCYLAISFCVGKHKFVCSPACAIASSISPAKPKRCNRQNECLVPASQTLKTALQWETWGPLWYCLSPFPVRKSPDIIWGSWGSGLHAWYVMWKFGGYSKHHPTYAILPHVLGLLYVRSCRMFVINGSTEETRQLTCDCPLIPEQESKTCMNHPTSAFQLSGVYRTLNSDPQSAPVFKHIS